MKISAQDISITIDGNSVIDAQSVEANPGELLVLAGKSGSGKTTLLNALGLLRRFDSGRITVGDAEATRWSDGRRRTFWRDHVAFVFQDYGLIEEETVEYNITTARRRMGGISPTDRDRVSGILAHVLLDGRQKERTSRLSGGEKQRVGLARAMFRRANIVLADEPTASLDRGNRELVMTFLREEATRGATVVVATHDEDLMAAADRVITLS